MAVDLKVISPDASVVAGAFLFGADSQSAASPSVYPIDDVADYVNTLGPFIAVATRTALKAADQSRIAYLTEADYEGLFRWDAALDNQRALADTQELTYVSPNTAVDGAWVRATLAQHELAAIDNALNVAPATNIPEPSKPSLALLGSAAGLDLGRLKNLVSATEDLAGDTHWSLDQGAVLVPAETMVYEGVTLQRLNVTSFLSRVRHVFAADFLVEAGVRYIISCYAAAPHDWSLDRFVHMRSVANATAQGHGAKLLMPKPRRIWGLWHATTTGAVDPGTSGIVAMGSGVTETVPVVFQNTSGNAPPVGINPVYLGGWQLERAPNQTERPGIALIGTSIDTSTSSLNHWTTERAWPRWLEGLLNVPIYNKAIGAQTSTTLEARFDTDVGPVLPNSKYCILAMNVNDYSLAGYNQVTYRANWTSMYNKAVAGGSIPVVVTPARRSVYDYAAGPADLQSDCEWAKATFPCVIDRDYVIADVANGSLLNRLRETDAIHYDTTAARYFAMAIFQRYRHLFHFDNVPTSYQPWSGDTVTQPKVDGVIYNESTAASIIDVAGSAAQTNLRNSSSSRAPTLILTGVRTATGTVQISATHHLETVKPTDRVKQWVVINDTTGGYAMTIQVYSTIAGVLTALPGAVSVAAGQCKVIVSTNAQTWAVS